MSGLLLFEMVYRGRKSLVSRDVQTEFTILERGGLGMAHRSTKYLLGLLSGAAVGAGLALLFAPDKGSNTRDQLSFRLGKYRDELLRLIGELKKEKEQLISEAKQKGDEVVLDAKQRADDLIREAEGLLENIDKKREK